MISPVYTVKEVAALEGRTTQWVSTACADGRFPGAYQSGRYGQWRIPEEAILAHRQASQPTSVGGLERRTPRARARRT